MSQGFPAGRLELGAVVPKQIAALQRFGHSDLDPTIAHLVEMRASQMNGCAFCLDMHWKDARAAGEEEAKVFEEDELGALLCKIAAINAWNRLQISEEAATVAVGAADDGGDAR